MSRYMCRFCHQYHGTTHKYIKLSVFVHYIYIDLHLSHSHFVCDADFLPFFMSSSLLLMYVTFCKQNCYWTMESDLETIIFSVDFYQRQSYTCLHTLLVQFWWHCISFNFSDMSVFVEHLWEQLFWEPLQIFEEETCHNSGYQEKFLSSTSPIVSHVWGAVEKQQ